MHSKLVRVVGLGVFMLCTTMIAVAQQNAPSNQSIDLGKSEYEAHCAVCHVLNGHWCTLYPLLDQDRS